ncbi:MAG: hypothetical protein KF784_10930 [Fimbriimonadaceae bacterium]|nr:hypothetical protein [Fimbriimonadaceae bacterium]
MKVAAQKELAPLGYSITHQEADNVIFESRIGASVSIARGQISGLDQYEVYNRDPRWVTVLVTNPLPNTLMTELRVSMAPQH